MLDALRADGFDVLTRNHAGAILAHDFAGELETLVERLRAYRVSIAEIVGGGGGESGQTQRLRHALARVGWNKHQFTVQTIVDGRQRESISHEVDHVCFASGGALALEIEWNNKDPFFDRDLENFQRLHALSAISVGVIVTRGSSLQEALLPRVQGWLRDRDLTSEDDVERLRISERTRAQRDAVARQVARGVPFADAFAKVFVSSKFGHATTHWSKLADRIARGVGNPCPLVLIGLPGSVLTDDEPDTPMPPGPDLFSQ